MHMKLSKLNYFLIYTALLFSFCFSQSGHFISGKVVDKDNTPLFGANIILKGTFMGSTSDFKGNYRIENIDPGKYSLMISYIGYKSQELEIYISEFETLDDDEEDSESSFSSKLGIEEDEEESEEEDSDYEEEDEPSSSLTVILIDEVDFIYEADGDSGFWSALGSVAKTAKCPIFLTANGFPPSGPRKYKQHIKLQRPTPAECAVKLLQLCRQEQMQFKGGLNGDVVKSKMAFLAEVCDCDLRRAMNELQSYMYANETNQCQDYALLNHAYIQEDDSAKVRASTALPVIQSIEPRVVPTKEYSKVVVRGKNFGFFARCGEEYEVWIGNQICKSHVKNDETLLVLCPPYNPTCGRVPPISIFSKSGQCWTTNKVERLDLIGGSHLDSVQSFSVQYVFPQDLWEESDDTDSNDEENELEANLSPSKPIGESALENDKEDMKVVEEKGKEMWERILSESPSEVESLAKDTRKLDYELQVGLEALSVASHNLSDAALFEDMQQGLPYLSGACQGLGFELTGGNEGDQGKLKRNENSRP